MTTVVRLEGLTPYEAAHGLQQALVALRAAGGIDDVLLVLEHPPTITLGRHRGAEESVVTPGDVPVVTVERGGNATWHAPGQLVVYPLVQLEGDRRDLRGFLRGLEEAVLSVLRERGVLAVRDERNTGVWIEGEGLPRKVCSMGIACRRWVTWHGLALNVDVDLAGFARIRPCGFGAEVMTRLADVLESPGDVGSWAEPMVAALVEALELSPPIWRRCTLDSVEGIASVVEVVESR